MISVVYYAYIPSSGIWQDIIYKHIDLLVQSRLSSKNIYIHITSSNLENTKISQQYINDKLPGAIISRSRKNQFEYPGINKVWQVAQQKPHNDHHILYFHSKGMRYTDRFRRDTFNKPLLNKVISQWPQAIRLLKSNPRLNKVGFAPSHWGWIWYNFWWSRASYLASCPKPIISSSRHYYEKWLGMRKKHYLFSKPDDCYSLAHNKIGRSYDTTRAALARHALICREERRFTKELKG